MYRPKLKSVNLPVLEIIAIGVLGALQSRERRCVPAVRLATVARRAFSVAGARVWNALPADVVTGAIAPTNF